MPGDSKSWFQRAHGPLALSFLLVPLAVALVAPRSNGGLNFYFAMVSSGSVPVVGIIAAAMIARGLQKSRARKILVGAILSLVFSAASGFVAFIGCSAISESGGR